MPSILIPECNLQRLFTRIFSIQPELDCWKSIPHAARPYQQRNPHEKAQAASTLVDAAIAQDQSDAEGFWDPSKDEVVMLPIKAGQSQHERPYKDVAFKMHTNDRVSNLILTLLPRWLTSAARSVHKHLWQISVLVSSRPLILLCLNALNVSTAKAHKITAHLLLASTISAAMITMHSGSQHAAAGPVDAAMLAAVLQPMRYAGTRWTYTNHRKNIAIAANANAGMQGTNAGLHAALGECTV